jgi:hypothetical protein
MRVGCPADSKAIVRTIEAIFEVGRERKEMDILRR